VGRFVGIGLLGIALTVVIAFAASQLWMYRATSVVGLGPRPSIGLQDIQRVSDLEARFDQDAGRPRLVVLISPT
jgi:hypothetical protein